MSVRRIAIIAGTTEGRRLAEYFDQPEIQTDVFVASDFGQKLLPELKHGQIHIGRMDEEDFVKAFQSLQIKEVYDATHPYAKVVSQTVKAACERIKIAYHRIVRENLDVSKILPASQYSYVESAKDAVAFLQEKQGNIFAAIGSKEAREFTGLYHFSTRVVLRVLPNEEILDALYAEGFMPERVETGVGPFSLEENEQLLTKYDIQYMVTKESGAEGGFLEKIEAAKEKKVFVVLMKRPEEEGIRLKEIIGE